MGAGFTWLVMLLLAVPVYAQGDQPEEPTYNAQIVQVDTSNYPEINVYISVTDSQGNPVRTLNENDFTLTENGQPVDISQVYQAGEQGPVTAVLAIDRSGSMLDGGKLDAAKNAAQTFVELMRPEDQTGVVVFNTQVDVIQPLTTDKNTLQTAIQSIQAFNDTAVYDGLAASIGMLQGTGGRKAIILLSDGLDNRSHETMDGLLENIQQAEISIYTIGLGDPSAGLGSTAGIDETALQTIASESRGEYAYAPEPDHLSGLYQQISVRLQNEYRLTYSTPNTLRDGVARGIEVHVAQNRASTDADMASAYNPGGVIPETAETVRWPILGALVGGLVVLLMIPETIRLWNQHNGGRKSKGRVKLTTPSKMEGPPTRKAKSQTTASRIRVREK